MGIQEPLWARARLSARHCVCLQTIKGLPRNTRGRAAAKLKRANGDSIREGLVSRVSLQNNSHLIERFLHKSEVYSEAGQSSEFFYFS